MAQEFAAWSGYNYVLGNPVKLVDRDGRAPEDIIVLNAEGSEAYRWFKPGEHEYYATLPEITVTPNPFEIAPAPAAAGFETTGASGAISSDSFNEN